MTYLIGIGSDSTMTEGILLESNVVGRRFLYPAPFRLTEAIAQAWEALQTRLDARPFLVLISYGRQSMDYADKQVTEISCHGLGIHLLAPGTRTVIDIGGQGSRVVQLDDDGNLSDFLMSDKYAAGTGRFLEVVSRTLGVNVKQLDAITAGVEPYAVTSMCTVFTESEAISLRSAGVAPETALAGVVNAMAQHSADFIGRPSKQAPLLFTGGVDHCHAFARMFEGRISTPIRTYPDAQLAGAIEAALIGRHQGRHE